MTAQLHVRVFDSSGAFAEDKDAAAAIRENKLKPALLNHANVTLDFVGVEYATQSFIHAMIAQLVRRNSDALDLISFTNCSDPVRGIIEIVADYSQEDDLI